MPQETNLNISPYFDDFNGNKDYYKVLFKPGYPIQARELTSLQSILQSQIERFGKHIFKEGSSVIGGEPNFISPVYAIQVSEKHNGIPISLYINSIINKKIVGQTSGVTAEVLGVVSNAQSEKSNYTLYVKYIRGGGTNFENSTFFELENLITESELVTSQNAIIQPGQTAFDTIATGGVNYQGSIFEVNSGIFFVRGYFVSTPTQRIITSQYDPIESYKVGFRIDESIFSADQDTSLYDNAKGFSNYAAPGADRFSIQLVLIKKELDEEDANFIEILRIIKGQPHFIAEKTSYSLIRDELASRTYDHAGDFFVSPFTVFARETLNDGYKIQGLYKKSEITFSGNNPSEDLLTYQIGPGKAYVGGYDVETIATTLIDVSKPRTTKAVENKAIPYNAGSLAILNNTYGAPIIGLGVTDPVSLMDSRLGSNKTVAAGTTIGYARVYDYIPETQYVDNKSRMNIRLFDIDIFSKLTLTSNITLSSSTRIEGKISKATGFVKDSVVSSNTIILYSVNGNFMDNEPIIIDGVSSNRFISRALNYQFSDVKSLYSSVGVSTFSGDFVLSSATRLASLDAQFQISSQSSGVSTVTTGVLNVFTNKIKEGDIITYNNPNYNNIPVYNKVTNVSAGGTYFNISGITTVTGICEGNLPNSNLVVNNISKIESGIDNADSSLITSLPNSNISNVNLENNTLLQRRQFSNVSFSSNQISVTITEEDLFFADFDEDNFLITYSDGSSETLFAQMYNLSLSGKILTFSNLSKTSGVANIIATLINVNPNPINKNLNKLSSLIVDKSIYVQSGIGTTTLNDGLTYNKYYGLRVQDAEISLNVPDVIRVLAVYESSDTQNPKLPILTLTSFDGILTSANELEIGDVFEGSISNAVAMVASIVDANRIEYVSLNNNTFSLNEKITFNESEVSAVIVSSSLGSRNITSNYTFNSGQKLSIADYSKIIRKSTIPEPKGKLRIIYQNYISPTDDTGELITVNSYSYNDYGFDMPIIETSTRASDVIDIRPRVKTFVLTNKSPFEYTGRQLNALGKYSSYTLAPNKNLILNYSYYLPRIDVISLNTNGIFEVLQGVPSDNPNPPQLKPKSLDIATITLPPYMYSSKDAIVNMSIHKRYRMSDVSLLERRIENVETVTSLNLLELQTSSITIKDAETGLDRFKSGFFADAFTNQNYSDSTNPQYRSYIYSQLGILGPIPVTRNLDLQLGSEAINGFTQTYNPIVDYSYVTDLGSPGIKKSQQTITLDYTEVSYINQPYANTETNISGIPIVYNGNAALSPSEDTWYETKLIERNTFVEGTTTGSTEPIVENITNVVNQKGPDIIRYLDSPKSVPTYTPEPPVETTKSTENLYWIPTSTFSSKNN